MVESKLNVYNHSVALCLFITRSGKLSFFVASLHYFLVLKERDNANDILEQVALMIMMSVA
jgi:hypothetical protein